MKAYYYSGGKIRDNSLARGYTKRFIPKSSVFTVSAYNKETLIEFMKELERNNLSSCRKARYISIFKILDQLDIDLNKLTTDALDRLFFFLKEENSAEWTKITNWKCFKHICKWMKLGIDFSSYHFKIPELNPEILTEREIAQMILATKNFKHKLIIMLLYESGMRAGELINLKKNDILFDENGAVVTASGKTGMRKIRIVKTAEFLKPYCEFYENKLFDMSEQMLLKIVRDAGKKAGINKRIYSHLLRHSRATHLAKYLTEPEMRLYFGWTKNSNMPSVYVHLSARDIDDKIINLARRV
jgi:integrase/recombinase XerD